MPLLHDAVIDVAIVGKGSPAGPAVDEGFERRHAKTIRGVPIRVNGDAAILETRRPVALGQNVPMEMPADRLRKIRESQTPVPSKAAWARKLGVNVHTYKSVESGIRNLTLELAEEYGAKLGRHPAWLLYGDAAGVQLTPEEQAMLDMYKKASQDGKKAAKAVLSATTQQDGSLDPSHPGGRSRSAA